MFTSGTDGAFVFNNKTINTPSESTKTATAETAGEERSNILVFKEEDNDEVGETKTSSQNDVRNNIQEDSDSEDGVDDDGEDGSSGTSLSGKEDAPTSGLSRLGNVSLSVPYVKGENRGRPALSLVSSSFTHRVSNSTPVQQHWKTNHTTASESEEEEEEEEEEENEDSQDEEDEAESQNKKVKPQVKPQQKTLSKTQFNLKQSTVQQKPSGYETKANHRMDSLQNMNATKPAGIKQVLFTPQHTTPQQVQPKVKEIYNIQTAKTFNTNSTRKPMQTLKQSKQTEADSIAISQLNKIKKQSSVDLQEVSSKNKYVIISAADGIENNTNKTKQVKAANNSNDGLQQAQENHVQNNVQQPSSQNKEKYTSSPSGAWKVVDVTNAIFKPFTSVTSSSYLLASNTSTVQRISASTLKGVSAKDKPKKIQKPKLALPKSKKDLSSKKKGKTTKKNNKKSTKKKTTKKQRVLNKKKTHSKVKSKSSKRVEAKKRDGKDKKIPQELPDQNTDKSNGNKTSSSVSKESKEATKPDVVDGEKIDNSNKTSEGQNSNNGTNEDAGKDESRNGKPNIGGGGGEGNATADNEKTGDKPSPVKIDKQDKTKEKEDEKEEEEEEEKEKENKGKDGGKIKIGQSNNPSKQINKTTEASEGKAEQAATTSEDAEDQQREKQSKSLFN